MDYKLLTIREVAALFQVHVSTIYKMVRTGECPAPIRIGSTSTRWRSDELEKWLDERPTALDVPAPQHQPRDAA